MNREHVLVLVTTPGLRLNAYFPQWSGLFWTCGTEKIIRHVYMYIMLQGLVIILPAYSVVEYCHTWATGVWLVAVQTGPSYPHVHSRLIL